MGTCKALLQHPGGTSMLEAHVLAFSRHCESVVVVAGADAEAIRAELPTGCQLVENPAWETTDPYHSLKLGLSGVASSRVLVTPVDTPPVLQPDLEKLLSQHTTSVLCWQGKPGHPVLLHPNVLERIKTGERPSGGLQDLLRDVQHVEASGSGVLANWNTPEQWQSWYHSTTSQNSC